jgi:hypothetical protein
LVATLNSGPRSKHCSGRERGTRSPSASVVHGEGAEIEEEEYNPLIHEAEDWLRESLVRILRSPNHLDAFETAKKRHAYFERLVFGEPAEAVEPDH